MQKPRHAAADLDELKALRKRCAMQRKELEQLKAIVTVASTSDVENVGINKTPDATNNRTTPSERKTGMFDDNRLLVTPMKNPEALANQRTELGQVKPLLDTQARMRMVDALESIAVSLQRLEEDWRG